MFSKYSSKSTKTLRSLNITNNTNYNHRRSFEDSNSFNNLLLMSLRTRTIQSTNNMSHTSFVTHESSKMRLLSSIILRETTDVTTMMSTSLTRKETKITVTRT